MIRCVWPLPPDQKANRISVGFLDPDYPKFRKQMGLSPDEHPGVDINLSGTSGDQDLRYPVVAVLPGKVAHAGRHRVWGNIVLVEHPPLVAKAFGYEYLATQYAHLHDILVAKGDVVYPGEPVGTIGKGDPARPFLAHLHFEVRIKPLPPDNWPKTKAKILDGYIDPVAFLEKNARYERRYLFGVVKALPDPSVGGVLVNLLSLDVVWVRGKV